MGIIPIGIIPPIIGIVPICIPIGIGQYIMGIMPPIIGIIPPIMGIILIGIGHSVVSCILLSFSFICAVAFNV
ncbi:MAG: hypothetical protein E3K36_17020 [Candidatus Brocadia sp.]|nr:hypothetical protein [Candidatus Brocadia sp.]